MRVNFGNVEIEIGTTNVRIKQNTPHPEKLDCHLTFDEVQKLGNFLLSIKKNKPIAVQHEDLL